MRLACRTVLRACPVALPLLLEGTTALWKACTLLLNTASVQALFLSALFSSSLAGFRQQPCRISAADPAAGFPGCLCPFLVRRDVLDMESSPGPMCQCFHLAGCCKTGGIAADCCFLLIKSSFCLASGFYVLSFPSKNWLGAKPLGDLSPLFRCSCGWAACCGVKRN